MITNGIELIKLRDFETSPVWRFDEDCDLYFPVLQGRDLPESERDVSIFVECKSNFGHPFDGYIVGIDKVFSMGLFCGRKVFHLNKNLPELSAEQMKEFLVCAGLSDALNVKDLFPLTYTTQIKRDEFRDFSGQFEMAFN